MSGHLPKAPDSFAPIPGAKVAIIASMWHDAYIRRMIDRASTELMRLDVAEADIAIHRLPGSLELPLAARLLFEQGPQLDGIIAFGIVLQGGTTHNTTVLEQVVHGFGLVSQRFAKPIINEVIGVATLADADARSQADDSNKGLEAAFAFSEFLHWRRSLGSERSGPKIGFGS